MAGYNADYYKNTSMQSTDIIPTQGNFFSPQTITQICAWSPVDLNFFLINFPTRYNLTRGSRDHRLNSRNAKMIEMIITEQVPTISNYSG